MGWIRFQMVICVILSIVMATVTKQVIILYRFSVIIRMLTKFHLRSFNLAVAVLSGPLPENAGNISDRFI